MEGTGYPLSNVSRPQDEARWSGHEHTNAKCMLDQADMRTGSLAPSSCRNSTRASQKRQKPSAVTCGSSWRPKIYFSCPIGNRAGEISSGKGALRIARHQ